MTGPQAAAQAQDNSSQNASIFTMRYSTTVPKYGFVIGFMTGQPGIGGVTAPQVQSFNGTMTLPLPAGGTMEDRQDVAYTEYKFGPLFGSVLSQNQGALRQDIAQAIASGGSNINPNNIDIAGQNAGQTGLAGLLSLGAFAGIQQDVGAVMGTAVRQFQTILLDGPTYKNYSFSFNLAPQNAQESTMIRQMITRLRKAAAPALGALNLFWDFPEIVQCVYVPQGNEIDSFMYPFMPAVLTTVDARYAPGGTPAFFNTTAPESITLTLSFKELQYWIRQSYNG
jgi:hypothetical protein